MDSDLTTESFMSLIASSFKRVQGILGILASIVLAVFLDKQSNIPIKWVVPAGILLSMITLSLGHAAYRVKRALVPTIPRVVYGTKPEGKSKIICLLNPSPLFSYGTLVSFYYENEGFEELLGFGRVVNIQDNKLIQVELTYPYPGRNEILEHISQNNSNTLQKLKVKPTITDNYSEAVQDIENHVFGQENNNG